MRAEVCSAVKGLNCVILKGELASVFRPYPNSGNRCLVLENNSVIPGSLKHVQG